MEQEYATIESKLREKAMRPDTMGFVSPGMLTPTRETKHGA